MIGYWSASASHFSEVFETQPVNATVFSWKCQRGGAARAANRPANGSGYSEAS